MVVAGPLGSAIMGRQSLDNLRHWCAILCRSQQLIRWHLTSSGCTLKNIGEDWSRIMDDVLEGSSCDSRVSRYTLEGGGSLLSRSDAQNSHPAVDRDMDAWKPIKSTLTFVCPSMHQRPQPMTSCPYCLTILPSSPINIHVQGAQTLFVTETPFPNLASQSGCKNVKHMAPTQG